MKGWRIAAGACIVAAFVGASIAQAFSAEPDSSFSNGQGDALFQEASERGLDVRRAVGSPARLVEAHPSDTALVVLSAPRPYTKADLEGVQDFLRAGGVVLVADTTGHGTQLSLLAGLALERVRLLEPAGSFSLLLGGTKFSVASANATAAKIDPGASAQVVAWSSSASFLDRNSDGVIGASDPPGPFPIVVWADVGLGRAWVVAVPDVLTGPSAQDAGHAAFRELLLDDILGDRSILIIDESKVTSTSPMILAIRGAVRATLGIVPQWLILSAAATAVVAISLRTAASSWRPHVFDARRFRMPEESGQGSVARNGWTSRGLAASGLAILLAATGLVFESRQATWASAFLVMAIAWALLLREPRGRAERTIAKSRVEENTSVEVTVVATVRGHPSLLQLSDELDSTMQVLQGSPSGTPQGGKATLSYTVSPARLGLYEIGPLRARRQDVFGLRVTQRDLTAATELKVTPRLEKARRTPFRSKVPQILLGGHQVQRAGSGAEFLALRDYQPGDAMRMVNWKASARSKGLVVNQRVHESPTQLTVLVDTRASSDVGPSTATPFVRGCRAAASIASGAMKARDRVRFVLYGNGVVEVSGQGSEHQRALEDKLAGSKASGETPLAEAVSSILPTLRSGRPVVVITGADGDATVKDAMILLRQRGARPFLVCPEAWERPSPHGNEGMKIRARTIQELRNAGVPVFEAFDGLPLEDLFRIQGGAA